MAETTSQSHKCSVCLELLSEPKVLPCCHTFCLECLKKTATASGTTEGQITCPKCRQFHQIPEGGLSELLTDFVASYEVEAVGLKSNTPTSENICGECEESGPVSCFCTDCQCFLCAECEQLHKKVKAYRAHKVVPKDAVSASSLQSRRVHYCSVHKAEVLKLYCETCEELVCRDCTLVEHRQHSYKFVQDARKQIEAEMTSLKSDVWKKLTSLRQNLAQIKKVETAAAGHPQVVKADINSYFDNLVRALEVRRSALLQEAEGVCQRDLKQVWADRDFHETTIASISAVVGLAEKARKCTSDSEMILTALQSIRQLRMIKEREWDSHAFAHVTLSTPTFKEGEKVSVNKVGSLDFTAVEEVFHIELVQNPQNQRYGGLYGGPLTIHGCHGGTEFISNDNVQNLGGKLMFGVNIAIDHPAPDQSGGNGSRVVIPSTQSLLDGRSGKSISLQRTADPDLKTVVVYGRSAKNLDNACITVEKQNIDAPNLGTAGGFHAAPPMYGGGLFKGSPQCGSTHSGEFPMSGLQYGSTHSGGLFKGSPQCGSTHSGEFPMGGLQYGSTHSGGLFKGSPQCGSTHSEGLFKGSPQCGSTHSGEFPMGGLGSTHSGGLFKGSPQCGSTHSGEFPTGGLQYGSTHSGGLFKGSPQCGSAHSTRTTPSIQRSLIASYHISVRLVCGGRHTITLKFGVSELKHTFTVKGRPDHGTGVKKGPDWGPHLSALPHPYKPDRAQGGRDGDAIGTVHRRRRTASSQSGLRLDSVSPKGVSMAECPDMVVVDEGSGIVGQYKWGKEDAYEIELV